MCLRASSKLTSEKSFRRKYVMINFGRVIINLKRKIGLLKIKRNENFREFSVS
jgi:hypothetical protein